MKQVPLIVPILISVLLATSFSEAATLTATDCSSSAVQTAINAAYSGDTVVIPAGSCTWSTEVTTNKPLTLTGAGTSNTTGTVLQMATGISNGWGSSPGLLISSGTGPVTVSNMRMTSVAASTPCSSGLIQITGTLTNFRITNVYFDWRSATYSSCASQGWHDDAAIFVNGTGHGVIDHCTFAPSVAETYKSCVMVYGDSDTKAYARPSALGTANSVYVEGNTFSVSAEEGWTHACWGQQGGSWVVRFNNITNYEVDMHGRCSWQGGREFEYYRNTVTASSKWGDGVTELRGGSGMVFDNTITTTDGYTLPLLEWYIYEICEDSCDPSFGGSCWCTSYPCTFQLGRGQNNVLQPVYYWNNMGNGSPTYPTENAGCTTAVCGSASPSTYYMANRDYYYQGTSFNGSTGVGRGTLSNRPAACTAGVGYWAIDQGSWNQSGSGGQGVLYKCTATNTWTLYYTPYTYPHPLVTGAAKTPNPPTNLQVTQ